MIEVRRGASALQVLYFTCREECGFLFFSYWSTKLVIPMLGSEPFNERGHRKTLSSRAFHSHVPLQILLVEDDESSQRLTSHILIKNGMQVDVVANGHDALSAVSAIRYDVILMDVTLPGISGLELTGLIREKETGFEVWILALTACAMPGDRKRCLDAGMDGYLSKPYTERELIELIQKLRGLI